MESQTIYLIIGAYFMIMTLAAVFIFAYSRYKNMNLREVWKLRDAQIREVDKCDCCLTKFSEPVEVLYSEYVYCKNCAQSYANWYLKMSQKHRIEHFPNSLDYFGNKEDIRHLIINHLKSS